LSGHLLLGVVRIYSRKVNYLMEDAHEASVKIDTTFSVVPVGGGGGGGGPGSGGNDPAGGAPRASRGGAGGGASERLDLANFGDLHQAAFSLGGGFEIPTDMIPELEDWDVAGVQDDDDYVEEEDRVGHPLHGGMGRRSSRGEDREYNEGDGPPRKRPRRGGGSEPDDSVEYMALSLDTTTTDDRFSPADAGGAAARSSLLRNRGSDRGVEDVEDRTLMDSRNQQLTTTGPLDQEDWGAFDPEDDDDEEDGGGGTGGGGRQRRDSSSSVLEIEATRAAVDASNSSDLQVRTASPFC
jgi:cohesin complex subunit SCC1